MFIVEEQKQSEQQQLQKRNRVVSLAGVFSRALSVLTGRKINVNVVHDQFTKTPAWSSTHEVWLNLAEIKDDFTARSLTSLNGLSFHELGHLRYTPRRGSTLIQLIEADSNSRKLWESMNCLEDSRIENLLIAYLPSIKSWITATIADYLLDNQEMMNRAFPLIYGRYYLPKEVRQLATDSYINKDDVAELKDIIDEYTSLIMDSTTADRAFALIKRFSELLDNLPSMPQQPNGEGDGEGQTITIRIKNPNGHGNRPTEGYESSSNRPASRKEQQRDLEKVLKNRDVTIEIKFDEQPKEDSSDNNSQSQSQSQSSQSQPKKSQPQSQSNPKEDSFDDEEDDFDFDDDFDSDSDSPTNSPSKSFGDEAGESGSNQQVTDTLNDLLSDVLDDLSKEINQIAKQLGIKDLEGGNAKEPRKANYSEVVAPNGLVELSRAFGRELERLRAEHDPSWLRYRDSGKVNALRYVRGDDTDTIFDEWSEGRDDVTEIEAVILLDKSGSMSGENADNAYKSMWAIKKALERVNARTTVCVFDSDTELLYGADESAGTTIRDSGADGGTNPKEGILYAKKILAETEKPIRILFMITDGQWDSELGEQSVIEMKNAGVLTCQALITGVDFTEHYRNYLESNRHGFELITSIKSAKDITTLGKELVRMAIKRNLVVSA